MRSGQLRFAVAAMAVLVGACSSGGGGASNQPLAGSSVAVTIIPQPTATSTTTAVPTPSEVAAGGGQPTPPAIDPCTLLTTKEASKLMGQNLSAGVSQELDPDRVCTWKDGLTEVKLILAPPAPDLATAEAYWDAERAKVPAGASVTDLSYFDRSAYVTATVAGASLSALFVIDGHWFFDLYCGFPACPQTRSVGAAQLISGRLP